MKIVFAVRNGAERKMAEEKMKQAGIAAEVEYVRGALSGPRLGKARTAEAVAVFVDSCLDAETLGKLSALKFIATRSTGFDHIDLEACRKRGITVSNVPSYGERTVAEYAFALILELSRGVMKSYTQVREEGVFDAESIQGFDLYGKTLGVVGTGKIGKNAARIGLGFGMKIAMCDTYPDQNFAGEIGCKYQNIEEVLRTSDIVTLHVPYMKETHHLMNAARLKMMKKGSYLINTSRGAVVDTQALIKVLRAKHLAGAGLDVLEEEDIMKKEADFAVKRYLKGEELKTVLQNHVLVDMPNVIVTPHNGFNTREANERILDTTIQNIQAFLKGAPTNVVT